MIGTASVSGPGYITELNPVGKVVWSSSFSQTDTMGNVAIDAAGNVYATFGSSTAFGAKLSSGVPEMYLVKFTPSGSVAWGLGFHDGYSSSLARRSRGV